MDKAIFVASCCLKITLLIHYNYSYPPDNRKKLSSSRAWHNQKRGQCYGGCILMINTDSELLYFVTNEASVFYQLLPMDAVKKKTHTSWAGSATLRVGGGTPHTQIEGICLEQENPCGRWVGGSFRNSYHFVVPSCKLELARFPAKLRIQDGAECGNKVTLSLKAGGR